MNICTSILVIILCTINEATIKPSDVRNYLASRTPYRYRYNKNDTKIKYPSKFYLLDFFVPVASANACLLLNIKP